MNLSDITTQPYILALFKRDDGQRFLLGSGAYEFKESQQHFVANAMVNDVVEVQGSDGALLAGQVRRASVQSFDGYIGDGGVIKSSVENYRKDFIAYFQKNHLYTVVYIFADGTAIQRKRGYIVDAPEVKELYQMTPEYHLALNFEDVNYYKYAENSDGDEMYSNYVNVTSATTSSGGLIWDTGGESSITAEGTQFNIYDTIAGTPLDSFTLKGQTVQQTYTGKNLLQAPSSPLSVWQLSYAKDSGNSFTLTTGAGASGSAYAEIDLSSLPKSAEITISFVSNRGTVPIRQRVNGTWGNVIVSDGSGYTFTTGSSSTSISFYTMYGSYSEQSVSITNIQIETGSQATTYEPYVGGMASPSPDYPQTVQVVTGVQKITIGDGGENTDIFTANLGSIELCKIGDYQDYIYKSGGDWYVHKETGVVDLAQRTWTLENVNYKRCRDIPNIKYVSSNTQIGDARASNYSIRQGSGLSAYPNWLAIDTAFVAVNVVDDTSVTPQGLFYYALATATDTKITDAFLIAELDGLLQTAECYDGVTTFKNEAQTAGSVPGWMVVEVTTGSGGIIWDNIGATWEEGGEGGDTYVTVDSITNVFPTITINGPAYNPKVTNVTTGQIIQYNGNVNGSQKLIIDIEQKTAKLSGTSVISNISGDWLYLTPGVNRLTYTIDNADKNYATIEWQEITG